MNQKIFRKVRIKKVELILTDKMSSTFCKPTFDYLQNTKNQQFVFISENILEHQSFFIS